MKNKSKLPVTESFGKELLALSPRDFVTKMFAPNLKNASDEHAQLCVDAFGGLFSGIPGFYDFQVQVPVWVQTASKKFWDYSGVDSTELQKGNPCEFAKMLGLAGTTGVRPLPTKVEHMANELNEVARMEAAKFPAKKAKEFFTALEKGESNAIKLTDPPKRIKVFMIISMSWRHVESLASAGHLHRWLSDIDAFDGEITDGAETRKICRLIGLRLRDAAGRPSK